jgi:hypothetical protein
VVYVYVRGGDWEVSRMIEIKLSRTVICVFVLTLLGIAGCAPTAPPAGAPQADLKWPPAGSSFVLANKNSGSFGSESGRATWKFLATPACCHRSRDSGHG